MSWEPHFVLEGPFLFQYVCPKFSGVGSEVVGQFFDSTSNIFRKGVRICRRPSWMFLHELDFFVPSDILRGYLLLSPASDHLTSPLATFWGLLPVPQFPHDGRGSKIRRGTASLCLGEYSTYLLRLMMAKVLVVYLIVPKGSQISLGFYEVLRRTDLQLRATSKEVCTCTFVLLVSWLIRCLLVYLPSILQAFWFSCIY